MISLIITFKLISYAHVLSNVREIIEKIKVLQSQNKDLSLYVRDSDLDSAVKNNYTQFHYHIEYSL